jgi:O-antigen/teichoic acid export membrane protein
MSELSFFELLQMLKSPLSLHKEFIPRFRRLSAEFIWVFVGQVASFIGAIVLVSVLTAHLVPSQYGQLALGLTAASFVNQVVMGGLAVGAGRYYAIAAEKQSLSGYLRATARLLGTASVAILLIGILLTAVLNWTAHSEWIGLVAAALLFATFSGVNNAINNIQNAARQRAAVAFHAGLEPWLRMVFAIGVIHWIGISNAAIVAGYACASLLITMSQVRILRSTHVWRQSSALERDHWTPQIWAYSAPFASWGVFTWMQSVSDRWALQAFSSASDVGQYAVLIQFGAAPVAQVTNMVVSFLGPILYQRAGDANDHARTNTVHHLSWKMAKLSLAIALASFAIALATHEWLFAIIVSIEYRSSSPLFPWVVLAGGLYATGQILALKLLSDMKPAAMTSAKIVTAGVGIALSIIGACVSGLTGVVIATLVFSSVYLFWMMMLAIRPSSRDIPQ